MVVLFLPWSGLTQIRARERIGATWSSVSFNHFFDCQWSMVAIGLQCWMTVRLDASYSPRQVRLRDAIGESASQGGISEKHCRPTKCLEIALCKKHLYSSCGECMLCINLLPRNTISNSAPHYFSLSLSLSLSFFLFSIWLWEKSREIDTRLTVDRAYANWLSRKMTNKPVEWRCITNTMSNNYHCNIVYF